MAPNADWAARDYPHLHAFHRNPICCAQWRWGIVIARVGPARRHRRRGFQQICRATRHTANTPAKAIAMPKLITVATALSIAFTAPTMAQQSASAGVRILAPAGAIKPTGTWGLGSRAGDFLYIAGMRGIDPKTDTLVAGDEARVRQAFRNMQMIAESEGTTLKDTVRLVVYVTDMFRFRPIVNKVQAELWGNGPYPPRTIVEVHRLNQDDIVEVEGTFWGGRPRG